LLNGTLVLNAQLSVMGNVTLSGYPSLITHEAEMVSGALLVGGTLFIGTGALVDVSEKGLPAARSINAVTGQEDGFYNNQGIRCGGSHGGLGGCFDADLQLDIFGDARSPHRPGGGGVNNSFTGGDYVSGAGGGVMLLHSTTLILEGLILADGEDGHENGNWDGGGGAGGSLWIETNIFQGSGVISASGGNGFGATDYS
jgi:hypothetical protein